MVLAVGAVAVAVVIIVVAVPAAVVVVAVLGLYCEALCFLARANYLEQATVCSASVFAPLFYRLICANFMCIRVRTSYRPRLWRTTICRREICFSSC